MATSVALQELGALRERLDRAADWFSDPDATMRAADLAHEVEQLCREANLSDNPLEAGALVAGARRCLEDLHKLLGLH